jgi:type VI secretion system secreted protein VgrG
VLDDQRRVLEIHDAQGNRIVLGPDGIDSVANNQRTVNRGNRAATVDGDDDVQVGGGRTEQVGGPLDQKVGGDMTVRVGGSLRESIGPPDPKTAPTGSYYTRTVGSAGVTTEMSGPLTEHVKGAVSQQVDGSFGLTAGSGIGLSTGGGINVVSGGPTRIAAASPGLGLTAIDLDAGIGAVSINTRLGPLMLGGLTAVSPVVVGDGLAIHHTMLAQILKAVNPLTVMAYGPALDVWAALTPVMDLSYFAFVKRFPVG